MSELGSDTRANGTMDQATFETITMRGLGQEDLAALAPGSGEDVRRIRDRSHASQVVFARHLHVTVGYVSQLKRGAKRPTGAPPALLIVVERKASKPSSGQLEPPATASPGPPATRRPT